MSTAALRLFDLGGVLIENATFTRLNQFLPPLTAHHIKKPLARVKRDVLSIW